MVREPGWIASLIEIEVMRCSSLSFVFGLELMLVLKSTLERFMRGCINYTRK